MTKLSKSIVLFWFIFVPVLCQKLDSGKPQREITKAELKRTDKEVTTKLNQLHNTIEALRSAMSDMNQGYDVHAKRNADEMKERFERVTGVISRLTKQNSKLFRRNKRLVQEKKTIANQIKKLESELGKLASEAANAGVKTWMIKTATELRGFLEQTGLEHFASPKFSPIVAGIVSNGVVIVPLVMTTLFLLQFTKQLTFLRVVMALNLFDLGFIVAIIASSLLLLGDPFEGMRHISEVNFVFIQMVLGGVFLLTLGFLVAAIVHNRDNNAWKYGCIELVVRSAIALDYRRRVWLPVMEREDVAIAMPAAFYVTYLVSAVSSVYFTSRASWHSVNALRQSVRRHEDDVMISLATHAG